MHQSRRRESLDTSPDLYLAFRSLLQDLLAADDSYKAKYLLAEFESKLLDPLVADSPETRRTKAINKWLACEVTNRDTNMRIMHMDETDVLFVTDEGFPVSAVEVADTAAKFIAATLGVVPDSLSGSFSGGASTGLTRGIGTIARKYLTGSNITEGAIWHFLRMTFSSVWAPRDFKLVRGNVMFTVPKTSQIDRVACKEPEFNMYAQKAVGDHIRRKLQRVGINLNDQSANQRLAKDGSKEGNLATVDLSSASDSVTTQLVLRLLPSEWFYLMQDLRSPETSIDGVWHLNEMFSSMGNGFTFELESLIFWALARSAAFHTRTKGRISVYGDDIICPVGLETSLLAVLEFFGFKVNPKKSFFAGGFRESCGKHWFNGLEVTPFYVKKVPVNVSDWCHLLNSLRRWCAVDTLGIGDPRYFDLWQLFATEVVPKPLWGSDDTYRIDQLVAPGRLPIARCLTKVIKLKEHERRLSEGCYMHWMDVTSGRVDGSAPVETSTLQSEGPLLMQRVRRQSRDTIPMFPQELEAS